MSSISNFSASYVQQVFGNVLQNAGITETAANPATAGQESAPDTTSVSPLAKVVSTLQQLQQSNPDKYAQVTGQIAANLSNAAQTAQAQGNSGAAKQLNQLASDFSAASQTGQLPTLQSPEKAGRGHHHHAPEAQDSATSEGSTTQGNANQQNTLDPGAIILNTLTSAGVNVSNSQVASSQ